MKAKILLVSNDLPPVPGVPVSGGGLRVSGLANGLESRGHTVVLSVPAIKLKELPARAAAPFRETAFQHDRISRVIRRVDPEILIVEQWALANFLEDVEIPLVIDLHGSLIMENEYRQHRSFQQNATAKVKALNKADLVICAGEVQRRYFMSWLVFSGFRPDELAIESVPVLLGSAPCSPRRPTKTRTWLFGGTAWPWVDPFPALEVTAQRLHNLKDHRLKVFCGIPEQKKVLPHDREEGILFAREAYEKLGSGNVSVSPLVSHARFLNECRRAYVALDVFQRNPERELAFVTRTAEYLWAGLPVVHADYDELGAWIREYEAGWVVDPTDEESIRETIEHILENPKEVERRSANARSLAAERLAWDRGIEPLHRFCVDPQVRIKSPPLFRKLSLEIARLEEEHDCIEKERGRERATQGAENVKFQREIEGRDHTIFELKQELASESSRLEADLKKLRIACEDKVQTADKGRVLAEEKAQSAQKNKDLVEDELRTKIAGRDRHIFELGQELEEHRDRLEKRVGELSRQVSAIEAERDELLRKCDGLSQDKDRCIEGAEVVRQEFAAARSEWADRKRRFYEEVRATRGERGQLEGRLGELQRDLADSNERQEGLESECDALKRELNGVQADLDRNRQALACLQEKFLNRLEDRLAYLMRRTSVQFPELVVALLRNSGSNTYLRIWERLTRKKVFPGT